MPKLLKARAAENVQEEVTIRKLARSRHAPMDVIQRAHGRKPLEQEVRLTQPAAIS